MVIDELRGAKHEAQHQCPRAEQQATRRLAAKAGGGVAGVLAAFRARDGTNRAKLCSLRLTRDIGRLVPVAALSEAVYGKPDQSGPLAMVMKGAFVMIEKRKPGYKIVKSGERGDIASTLSSVR